MAKEIPKAGFKLYQDTLDECICLDKASQAMSDLIMSLGIIDEVGCGKLVIGALNQQAKDNLNRIKGLLDQTANRLRYLKAEFVEKDSI